MKKILYCLFIFTFLACDDPSLNRRDTTNEIVEPIADLDQLSSIMLAENDPTNIVGTITFTYNDKDLISNITDSRTGFPSHTLTYNNNNSLSQIITVTAGVTTTYDVTTVNEQISVSINTAGLNTINKLLTIDTQNRINRMITTTVDLAGNSTVTEDRRYIFNQNFNLTTLNRVDPITSFVTRSSSFNYGINVNAFKDMNDIVRLLIFEEFIPFTRAMPSTQEDFENGVLQRSITTTYVLQADNLVSSRALNTTENGTTTTRFEFFNYRP